MAGLLPDPFEALFRLQQGLDALRASDWLAAGPSGAGSYPPLNLFRRGDDFVVIAEVPGINKSSLEIQAKGNTLRIAGTKSVNNYSEGASLHRRERLAGRFDRTVTLPMAIDVDNVRAESRDGILVLLLPLAERERPKSIKVE
jgi:HSP20 family protein